MDLPRENVAALCALNGNLRGIGAHTSKIGSSRAARWGEGAAAALENGGIIDLAAARALSNGYSGIFRESGKCVRFYRKRPAHYRWKDILGFVPNRRCLWERRRRETDGWESGKAVIGRKAKKTACGADRGETGDSVRDDKKPPAQAEGFSCDFVLSFGDGYVISRSRPLCFHGSYSP